jgi:hypothetical protein
MIIKSYPEVAVLARIGDCHRRANSPPKDDSLRPHKRIRLFRDDVISNPAWVANAVERP